MRRIFLFVCFEWSITTPPRFHFQLSAHLLKRPINFTLEKFTFPIYFKRHDYITCFIFVKRISEGIIL